MIFTDEMKKNALKLYLANPYWAEKYNDAPSDACRDRIVFTWCYSTNMKYVEDEVDADELKKETEELEAKLDLEDWKHLLKYAGRTPFSTRCRKKIEELGG